LHEDLIRIGQKSATCADPHNQGITAEGTDRRP